MASLFRSSLPESVDRKRRLLRKQGQSETLPSSNGGFPYQRRFHEPSSLVVNSLEDMKIDTGKASKSSCLEPGNGRFRMAF